MMSMGIGVTGKTAVVVVAPANRDPLNADPSHIIAVSYKWDDTSAWTDTNVWKD